MSPFEIAFQATELVEAGYVSNPSDPGGATNHGVTEKIARAYGYTGDMKDLSIDTAKAIAKKYFWDPIQGDDLAAASPVIASKVFDLNYQFYSGAAGMFLQRSLAALGCQVIADGHIGALTVKALNDFVRKHPAEGESVLLRSIGGLQVADYVRQTESNTAKREFFYGWLRKRVQ